MLMAVQLAEEIADDCASYRLCADRDVLPPESDNPLSCYSGNFSVLPDTSFYSGRGRSLRILSFGARSISTR